MKTQHDAMRLLRNLTGDNNSNEFLKAIFEQQEQQVDIPKSF